MEEMFKRTLSLIGEENLAKIQKSNILLIGLGGVGGYVAEALIRAGIENITLIDGDIITNSNKNRQILALSSTIGKDKVEVAKNRLLDINPNAKIQSIKEFLIPENVAYIDFSKFDFIIDAIDYTPTKLSLIEKAHKEKINIISSMGTGNKLNYKDLKIDYIENTSVCPLAKKIRQELKKRGIKKLPVLFSTESPQKTNLKEDGKIIPSSISTIPAIAGLMIANYVITKIIKKWGILPLF